jgi:hypothetical protein
MAHTIFSWSEIDPTTNQMVDFYSYKEIQIPIPEKWTTTKTSPKSYIKKIKTHNHPLTNMFCV